MNIIISGREGLVLIISIIIIAMLIILFMLLTLIILIIITKRTAQLIKTLNDAVSTFKDRSSDLISQTTNTIKSVETSFKESQNTKGAFIFRKIFDGIIFVSEIASIYNIFRKRGKNGKRG